MPELRKDPIIGRWVIIATERARRPQDFKHEADGPELPCPFCEGSEDETPPEIIAIRQGGARPNEPGWSARVVPSIAPLLRIEGDLGRHAQGVFDVMSGIGAHEIVIESPTHVPSLTDVSDAHVSEIVGLYQARILDLAKDARFKSVMLFKNHGRQSGATIIRHVRSQLIATPVIPKRVKEELVGAKRYFDWKDRCIFCDLIQQEEDEGIRLIATSRHMIAIAPFASRFPFEVWILPLRHACDFASMSEAERADFAHLLKRVLQQLKDTLADPPYNFIVHTAPFRRPKPKGLHWLTIEEDYHWHLEIIPRLTRVAGFEWGTGFYINPTPPEEAARFLREAHRQPAGGGVHGA